VIVDTTLTIDFLRRRPEAIAFLDELRGKGELVTHPVVIAETLQGARDRREQQAIETLFAHFQVVDVEVSDYHDSIVRLTRYSLSHGVGWHDCLIAATACRLAIPVATLNDRDFNCFGDLKVVRPY
jgi:predicted nucleic acid-binding protein